MKTRFIKYIVACFAVTTFTTGCSDYLDKMPDDQMTLSMVWKDRIRTEDWLAGVYQSVPDPLWGYQYRQGYNIFANELTIPYEWTSYGWSTMYGFMTGNWNPNTTWEPNYYVELPKRIRSGLIFLRDVEVHPEIGLGQAYVDQMRYEVRFLIAYYYALLLEHYGPFPFHPGVIMDPNHITMGEQTPFDTILDWIDKELLEVSQHLPAVYQLQTDWGKATSVAALAVRAKLLLMAASPLFNGNADFEQWTNDSGEKLFGPEDQNKWTRAREAHRLLIEKAEAAGYKLYEEYNDDGTIDPFMSLYNVQFKKFSDGNKEILWGKSDPGDYTAFQRLRLPKGLGGNAGMGVSQELVDAFFMENGEQPITGYMPDGQPVINPASGYKEKDAAGHPLISNGYELRKTKWTGGGPAEKRVGDKSPVTMPGTFNMYCHREPRFYISVIYNGAWLPPVKRQAEFIQGGEDTDLGFDSPQNGYNVRKNVPLEAYPKEGKYAYQPAILYRMAEAYLSLAETINETEGPTPEVFALVNKIRHRAGIPDLKLPEGLSSQEKKTAMREAILRERRVEFNLEGVRFFDLRRWKIGVSQLDGPTYGMNHKGNTPETFYVRTFLRNRSFSTKQYMWPIPQRQIDINPKLHQVPNF